MAKREVQMVNLRTEGKGSGGSSKCKQVPAKDECEGRIKAMVMERARLTAWKSTMVWELTRLSRRGLIAPYRVLDLVKACDDASMRVRYEDLTVAQVNETQKKPEE